MGSSMMLERSIEEIAKEAIPKISVLGVGGGGSNIVSWMKKEIVGARTLALNSDAQHLTITKADDRILLGYKTTGGLGCGGFPEQGERAAEESAIEIENAIQDAGLVFITSTLGGGTGTGASPVVARISKEIGALTLGVVTIPFQVESTRVTEAKEGLYKLVDVCDSVIVIDNNKLRKVAGELPLKEAFGVANKKIANFIKNMSEALSTPGHMNLDFADMKAIMKGGGVCAIGFGEGAGDSKVEEAVEDALNSQLLDIGDIKQSEGALIHIEGGENMTLEDINKAGELFLERVSSTTRVTWGAKINPDLEDRLRATIVLAGVESPFLKEKRTKKPPPRKTEEKKPEPKEKSAEKKETKKSSKKSSKKETTKIKPF